MGKQRFNEAKALRMLAVGEKVNNIIDGKRIKDMFSSIITVA